VRGRLIGVLEAYGPEALTERQYEETLISLANQGASALENARLYAELAERENRLQDLIRKLITVQEEERRKVSYEVHNDLAQTAAGAHQLLQAFARQYPPDSAKGRKDLARVLELVQQTVGEARYVIADLRPTALDDLGLGPAVRLQVEKISSEGSQVDYEEALGDERLPSAVRGRDGAFPGRTGGSHQRPQACSLRPCKDHTPAPERLCSSASAGLGAWLQPGEDHRRGWTWRASGSLQHA